MKDLLFFDLETTGVKPTEDRIVELYARRLSHAGFTNELHLFINPGMHIPEEATAVHHITDEQVKDCPKFADVAQQIFEFFSEAYICGHNAIGYDVVMLVEEFNRAGYSADMLGWPLDKKLLLDTYLTEKALHSHSLIATYKRYFGVDYSETIGEAHGAKADVLATIEVFGAQAKEIGANVYTEEGIEAFRQASKPNDDIVDIAGNLILIDDEICYNFGKNKGKRVKDDVRYAMWMLGQPFSAATKAIIKAVLR